MNFKNIKIKLMLWYSAIILISLATLSISIVYVFGEGMYDSLEELEHILFISIPIIVFLFILSGWFIINNVLVRVKNVIDEVHNIKAEDLGKRLSLTNSQDEIEELIITFNSMLDRLDESFSKIKRFSNDVSHELKTPLTVIRGEIELGLRKNRDEKEYKEILHTVLSETASLQELIDSLLFLSNSNTKNIQNVFELIDFDELFLDVLSSNKDLFEDKNITFELLEFENIKCKGNIQLVKIMLNNIIQNSIKYSHKDSKISISLKDNCCVIKDYGIGIKKDDLDKVFDRFYRTDESRTRGGYGLGLSIVKTISDLHGFKLDIHSEINQFTEMIIEL